MSGVTENSATLTTMSVKQAPRLLLWNSLTHVSLPNRLEVLAPSKLRFWEPLVQENESQMLQMPRLLQIPLAGV